MCLFIILLAFGPRTAIAIWWLVEPVRWSATFGSFFVPLLGFIFLPWTTLMYVLVAPNGVNGLDYLWLGLAIAADIAGYSASGVYGRRRSVTRPPRRGDGPEPDCSAGRGRRAGCGCGV